MKSENNYTKQRHRQKNRILIVGHIPPPQEGAAKLNELMIKSEYLKKSFQIKFLSLLKRKDAINRGKFGLTNIIYNIVNILSYIRLIIVFNPDLIYMSLAQNRTAFIRDSIFILIGTIFRKKSCLHFHGGNFDLFYKNQGRSSRKYIAFVLRRADQLILLADKFKKQFSSLVDNKKMVALYNCVPEALAVLAREERVFSADRKTKVLFIGYISKAKGALDLVKAASYIITRYNKPIEFILCGQPVDIERNIVFIPEPNFGYSKIKSLIAQEDLTSYINIRSELSSKEKQKLFGEADLFVFPSYSEGCALVVLEAMAFGLPVITTSVGALEEMLKEGDNCFFIEPGDINSLAEKILSLLHNPYLRKRMGEANRKLVMERYNPDVFLRKMADIWNDAFVLSYSL